MLPHKSYEVKTQLPRWIEPGAEVILTRGIGITRKPAIKTHITTVQPAKSFRVSGCDELFLATHATSKGALKSGTGKAKTGWIKLVPVANAVAVS